MHRKTPFKDRLHVMSKATIGEHSNRFSTICRNLLKDYPFHFIVGMFACILTSAVLAFTIMRVEESTNLPTFPGLTTDGLIKNTTDIIGSYGAVIELEELQHTIAVIIQKDSLSDRDSTRLSEALKRYEQIQRSLMRSNDINPRP